MADELFIFEIIIVVYLGLLFGSFASAIVYRIPRDIPWIKDKGGSASRSNCPNCGYKLRFWDLIPIFSWVFLKGRCRSCKQKISIIYPVIELSTVLGFVVVYIFAGLYWDQVFLYLLIPFLVALLYIDLEHFILPDELVAIMAACGAGHLGLMLWNDQIALETIFYSNILGAIVFGLLSWVLGITMSKILQKDALGFGDVKLFAAVGLWLGVLELPVFLMLSGVLGIVFALAWRGIKKEEVFPFGPALILSFFTLLFFDGSNLF